MSSEQKHITPFKAVLFKEWIKLRFHWTLMVAGSVAFAIYLCLRLRHTHEFNSAVAIWNAWIFKGFLFFDSFQYVPVGAGIALGFLQFLPEVLNKRIRLILHLPVGEEHILSDHLCVGILGLTLITTPALLAFSITSAIYFPMEFQTNLILTSLPWLLAGYAGYFFASAVLLEARWRFRVFHLIVAFAMLRLFFLGDFYDVYLRILPLFTLWTAFLFLVPLFSNHRFRKGFES